MCLLPTKVALDTLILASGCQMVDKIVHGFSKASWGGSQLEYQYIFEQGKKTRLSGQISVNTFTISLLLLLLFGSLKTGLKK